MHYHVKHLTRYRYTAPVSLCQNLAHLTPRDVPRQRCRHSELTVRPVPAILSPRVDSFGNPATFFSVQQPHSELVVTATHAVEVWPREAAVSPAHSPPWEQVRDLLAGCRSPAILEAYQFVFCSRFARADADVRAYALASFTPHRPVLEAAEELTARVHRDFAYDTKATTVSTPVKEVFARRRGVCQDFAHVQIACLRSLGLAARYVSGYLPTTPPPGQARLVGADATHAWLAVFCPTTGWVDFDPTNDQIPSDRHIVLGWGRDYDDVSPIKGVILGGGTHVMSTSV
ncbi:MAG: transglutaminase family protein, partial [Gemmataceae bacterium]